MTSKPFLSYGQSCQDWSDFKTKAKTYITVVDDIKANVFSVPVNKSMKRVNNLSDEDMHEFVKFVGLLHFTDRPRSATDALIMAPLYVNSTWMSKFIIELKWLHRYSRHTTRLSRTPILLLTGARHVTTDDAAHWSMNSAEVWFHFAALQTKYRS